MSYTASNLTFSNTPVTFNQTLYNDPSLCTLSTCPKDYATLQYIPSLGGNAFYLAWFLILLLLQIVLGIQKRTWTFLGAMVGGCVLELIGYGGRVAMHGNIFVFDWFLMYLICLTIAPCFFSAAIYLLFSRFVIIYSPASEDPKKPTLARFRPTTYTIIFISWDIISLVLQAAGGAMADTASDGGSAQTGINIMIAGLSSQVASLIFFSACCADFAFSVYKNRAASKRRLYDCLAKLGGSESGVMGLMASLAIAWLAIFIRSCFRVAELRGGFGGKLANDEVTFMVLEGAMIAVAALALTVGHPAFVFGRFWRMSRARAILDDRSEDLKEGLPA